MSGPSRAAMIAVAGALVLTASVPARAQGIDFANVELRTKQIAPHAYTLMGSPGADPSHPEATGRRIGEFDGPAESPWPTLNTRRLQTRCWPRSASWSIRRTL
jgi:hypothetical protein